MRLVRGVVRSTREKKVIMLENINSQDSSFTVAYGIFLDVNGKMFDPLHESNAKKKVDIAVKYEGIVREFTLEEFITLLGFGDV